MPRRGAYELTAHCPERDGQFESRIKSRGSSREGCEESDLSSYNGTPDRSRHIVSGEEICKKILMGRGRISRRGGACYHSYESYPPAAPTDHPAPLPFGGETIPRIRRAAVSDRQWFNSTKGFGFAKYPMGLRDAFLHSQDSSGTRTRHLAPGTNLKLSWWSRTKRAVILIRSHSLD